MTNSAKIILLFTLMILWFKSVSAQNKMWNLTNRGGAYNGGTILKSDIDGSNLEVIHSFDFCEGANPLSALTEAANGKLYGATQGLIFEYDPILNRQKSISDIHVSSVYGGFIEASDGYLYGIDNGAGSEFKGQIIRIDPQTSSVSALVSLTGQEMGYYSYSTLVEDPNGKFYATTSRGGLNDHGTILEFDPETNMVSKKIDFLNSNDAYLPIGGLTAGNDGAYYGMSYWGGGDATGAIYSYDVSSNTTSIILEFTGTSGSFMGSYPIGELVVDGDKMYGVTHGGGTYNYGVIFEYDYVNSIYTVLHHFNRADGSNGGARPTGVYLSGDGKLYGNAGWGGSNDVGLLFEYDLNSSHYTVLENFETTTTGGLSYSGGYNKVSIASDGNIYGTLMYGGKANKGTLFEYNISTSTFTKKLDFNSSAHGHNANSSLLQASNNKLYFTVPSGAMYNGGALYEIDPITNDVSKKHDFDASVIGRASHGELVQATNGHLYGVLQRGGENDLGAIFQYNLETEEVITVVTFDGINGAKPVTGLEEGTDGYLYGVTREGGTNNIGVVYKLDPNDNSYTKLADFATEHGKFPEGQIVFGEDGMLYGIATKGGSGGYGTIYAYDVHSGTLGFVKNLGFDAKNFGHGLTKAFNGKLYGLSREGTGSHGGSLIEFDPSDSSRTLKVNFWTDASGYKPYGKLSLMSNGNLYGNTRYGGSNGLGTFFEYNPYTDTYRTVINYNNTNGASPVRTSPMEFFESNSPEVTKDPASASLCQGESFELMVFSSGDNINYKWQMNGIDIEGASSSYLLIENVKSSDNGDYTCVLTNETGTVSSSIASLLVTDIPEITFDPIEAKTYGDTDFNITASVIKGSPIELNSSNTNVATLSGSTVSIVGGGSTMISASSSNSCFTSVVEQILLVNKADHDLIFNNVDHATYGDPDFELVASSSENVPVYFSSSNPEVISVSGSTATIVSAGQATVTAISGNSNYLTHRSDQSITIYRADQSINFESIPDKTYGDEAFELNAIANSSEPIVYSSSDEQVALVDGNLITIVGAGSVVITANNEGDNNYNPATSVSQTLFVNKADQNITFEVGSEKTFGETSFELMASADSGLPVVYLSSDESVIEINGNTATILGAGEIEIIASQLGDNNYNPAIDVSRTIAVNKANQVISFDALEEKIFGDPEFELQAMSDSGLEVLYISSDESIASVNGSIVTIHAAGVVTITAFQTGNTNYEEATIVEQQLTIHKSDQSISFETIPELGIGDTYTLNAIATSGDQVEFTSSDEAVATITGNELHILKFGEVTVTASQSGNENYNAAAEIIQILDINTITETIEDASRTLEIFPNPVMNQLTIKLDDKKYETIGIYNVHGKQLYADNVDPDVLLVQLNMSEFEQGVYIVQVTGMRSKKSFRVLKK